MTNYPSHINSSNFSNFLEGVEHNSCWPEVAVPVATSEPYAVGILDTHDSNPIIPLNSNSNSESYSLEIDRFEQDISAIGHQHHWALPSYSSPVNSIPEFAYQFPVTPETSDDSNMLYHQVPMTLIDSHSISSTGTAIQSSGNPSFLNTPNLYSPQSFTSNVAYHNEAPYDRELEKSFSNLNTRPLQESRGKDTLYIPGWNLAFNQSNIISNRCYAYSSENAGYKKHGTYNDNSLLQGNPSEVGFNNIDMEEVQIHRTLAPGINFVLDVPESSATHEFQLSPEASSAIASLALSPKASLVSTDTSVTNGSDAVDSNGRRTKRGLAVGLQSRKEAIFTEIHIQGRWLCPDEKCNKRFFKRFEANKHMKNHYKDVGCRHCGQSFANNRDRDRHETSSHSDVAKFPCPFEDCPRHLKPIKRRDNLLRHLELIHHVKDELRNTLIEEGMKHISTSELA